MYGIFCMFQKILVKWAKYKYKRLKGSWMKAAELMKNAADGMKHLFFSLGTGLVCLWLNMKSRMTGDCHVRFCESLGVKLPRSTRLKPIRRTSRLAA